MNYMFHLCDEIRAWQKINIKLYRSIFHSNSTLHPTNDDNKIEHQLKNRKHLKQSSNKNQRYKKKQNIQK